MSTETNEELEIYYNSLLDLFMKEGWKFLLEDLEEAGKLYRDLTTCKDEKNMYYRQGQLDIIGRIIRFEEDIKQSYADFLEDSSQYD